MRVFLALLIIAALAGPALAQDDHVQRYGEPDHEKTAAEKAAEKAAARAYEKSLNVIPDAGASDRAQRTRTEPSESGPEYRTRIIPRL